MFLVPELHFQSLPALFSQSFPVVYWVIQICVALWLPTWDLWSGWHLIQASEKTLEVSKFNSLLFQRKRKRAKENTQVGMVVSGRMCKILKCRDGKGR